MKIRTCKFGKSPVYLECPDDTPCFRVRYGKVDTSYYGWANAVNAFTQLLLHYNGERIELLVLKRNPRYDFYSWIIRAEA